jgi:hypothetical protein
MNNSKMYKYTYRIHKITTQNINFHDNKYIIYIIISINNVFKILNHCLMDFKQAGTNWSEPNQSVYTLETGPTKIIII